MSPSVETPAATATPPPTTTAADHAMIVPAPLFSVRSARVKCVDVHATQPWLLCALYDGSVVVHDIAANRLIKTFRVSSSTPSPVRTARFISRENWVIVGSDDLKLRVFHLDTNEIIAEFKAHDDYVRSVSIHETLPLVFSCGDDKLVKIWDWSKGWACVRELPGHDHYVMAVAASGSTLASGSLDHDVRLWDLTEAVPGNDPEKGSEAADAAATVATASTLLRNHERGINALALDGPASRLVTGSDDRTVVVWDLATPSTGGVVAAVLHGHTSNVTSVAIHSTLPLIVSASEDGSVRVWDSETFRCMAVWTHGFGRAWSLAFVAPRAIAIGYDDGTVVVELPLPLPAFADATVTAPLGSQQQETVGEFVTVATATAETTAD